MVEAWQLKGFWKIEFSDSCTNISKGLHVSHDLPLRATNYVFCQNEKVYEKTVWQFMLYSY